MLALKFSAFNARSQLAEDGLLQLDTVFAVRKAGDGIHIRIRVQSSSNEPVFARAATEQVVAVISFPQLLACTAM